MWRRRRRSNREPSATHSRATLIRDLPLDVGDTADPLEGLLYGASVRADVAGPPLGSGPYKIGYLQARHIRQLQATRRLLGQGSAGERGPLQFRRVALRVLSRPHARARRHAVGRLSTSARSSPPRTGRRATTCRRSREGRILRLTMPDERPSGAQGFFINTRRAKFRTRACARRLGSRSTSSGRTRTSSSGSTSARHSFFENSDMKATGPPIAEELALLEPFATSWRPKCSASRSRRR